MKVYHASSVIVENPDTIHSMEYLDFGQGFYITTIREQAEKYAQRFLRRGKPAWLNIYELSYNIDKWKLLHFDSYNSEWLDYVANCRIGKPVELYDMIIGGIANDRVILTLDRYFAGEILTLDRYFAGELSKEQALGLLKYEKPNIQLCIRSQQMIDECLTYIESIKL